MTINTDFLMRCILTLEKAYELLEKEKEKDTINYEMYRSACVKEFELILEQSGKLLKKCLKPYFHSSKAVDRLSFKDIFRHAAKHKLISIEQAERWFQYRDNRNTTTHDYGVDFANKTLVLLPDFILDAKAIEAMIKTNPHD